MYKCICGARYRSPIEFSKHYSDNIHTDWFDLSKQYKKCDICCNHHKTQKFIACIQCKNTICLHCCQRIYIKNQCLKCPFCRHVH